MPAFGNAVRSLCGYVAVVQLPLAVARLTMLRFGSEDPAEPDEFDLGNWHHLRLSHDAARQAGWSSDAALEMAWHTDYVDSYLYNPFWWAEGGPARVKASWSLAPTLKAVHFDDLTDLRQIATMWRRYLGALLAGVTWAAEQDRPLGERIATARHIVGSALHPVQDFYSHSNWVDVPARRGMLFRHDFRTSHDVALYTGNYEHSEIAGVVHHGRIAPECSVLTRDPGLLDLACHAASPMSGTAACEMYRACKDSVELGATSVRGVPIPSGLVHLAPPGIALDSRWVAPIGAVQRGFAKEDGTMLFEAACSLAQWHSRDVLCGLSRSFVAPHLASFWHHVQHAPPSEPARREAQFEDFHEQGVRFIGAGPYPPKAAPLADEWYLRVRIRTADRAGSGTNADIYAITDLGNPLFGTLTAGSTTRLDNLPGAGPVLGYDDFESGDDQVFHLGPFADFPSSLTLFNDAGDVGDVLNAFARSFVSTVKSIVFGIGDVLLSLIGGHADKIGTSHLVWTPAALSAIGGSTTAFSVLVDGDTEGRYRVHGTIRRTARATDGHLSRSSWAVRLGHLECVRESSIDRASESDEPFVIAMLANHSARHDQPKLFGPFRDVDDGEDRPLGWTFEATDVVDRHGHLTLVVQVWESDDEGRPGRNNALEEFATQFGTGTAADREGFLGALDRAVAADWEVDSVEVAAYGIMKDGMVHTTPRALEAHDVGVIGGDELRTFRLGVAHTSTRAWSDGCTRPGLRRLDLRSDGVHGICLTTSRGVELWHPLGPDNSMVTHLRAPHRTDLGGWVLDVTTDRIGPAGQLRPGHGDRVVVTGPQGIGVLAGDDGGLRVDAVREVGHDLGGWRVPEDGQLTIGPCGALAGRDREDMVLMSPDGLALVGLEGPDLVAHRVLEAGGAVAGIDETPAWVLDPSVDRLGPVGDIDGDDVEEFVLSGPQGLAVVKAGNDGFTQVARIRPGEVFGLGDPFDPDGTTIGPTVDLRGPVRDPDGVVRRRHGLIVTTTEGHALVELRNGALRSTAYVEHGAVVDEWEVDVDRDVLGPVGRLHDGVGGVWFSGAARIGVLTVRGHELVPLWSHPVGVDLSDWTPTPDTAYVGGRGVPEADGAVVAVDDGGVAILSMDPAATGRPVLQRVRQGTDVGGWRLHTATTAFQ